MTRRTGILAAVLLSGALAFAWLHESSPEPLADARPVPASEGEAPAGAPSLQARAPAVGESMPTPVPRGISIAGTVTRDGVPAAAEITVRLAWPARPWGYAFRPAPDSGFVQPEGVLRAQARTDEKGRFLVEGLAPGWFRVEASGADGARAQATVVESLDGVRAAVSLVLRPGHEVSGRVVLADGTPFSGSFAVEDAGTALTRCGPDGAFVLSGLLGTEVRVRFTTTDGYFVATSPLPREGPWRVTLPAAVRLRGRVVDAVGRGGVGGAAVYVRAWADRQVVAAVRTLSAADGRFEVALPSEEPASATVVAAGYEDGRAWLTRENETDIPLATSRLGRVEGRVLLGDGTPVEGLSIRAFPDGTADDVAIGGPTSDAQGRFAFDAPEGTHVVAAFGKGYVTVGLRERDPAAGSRPLRVLLAPGHVSEVAIEVARGEPLVGRVVEEGDRPVPGIVVYAQPYTSRQGGTHPQGLTAWLPTVTDAEGRFRFEGLDPEFGHAIDVRSEAFQHQAVPAGPAGPGGFPAVELRVLRKQFIRIEVIDDTTGAPVPMARVTTGSFTRSELRDGVYEMPVVSDRAALDLSASAPGYLPSAPVHIEPSDRGPVRIRLRRGSALAGRVELEDGTALSRVTVSMRPVGASEITVSAAEDGAFVFDAVAPGACRILVSVPGHRPTLLVATDVVAPTREAVLRVTRADLLAAGCVFVRVTDGEGVPVSYASVHVGGPGGGSANYSGPVPVLGARARAGAGFVVVAAAKGRDQRLLPLGPALVDLAADVAVLDVRLPPERTIRGRLLDPRGAPVPGARVFGIPRAAPDASKEDLARLGALASATQLVRSATTGGDGAFEIHALGDVAYTLGADVSAPWRFESYVTAQGGDRGVELRVVDAAPPATITVLDAHGRPLVGVFVGAIDAEGSGEELAGGRTDRDGRARIAGARDGRTYRLIARPEGTTHLAEVLERWVPADTTVRLREARTIRGVVADEEGNPPGDFRVLVKGPPDADDTEVHTEPDGRFTVRGLAPGSWQLQADYPDLGLSNDSTPWVEASAGATDVRLLLPVRQVLAITLVDPGQAGLQAHLIPESPGATRTVAVPADGRLRFRRCVAGMKYSLWIPPTQEGRMVWVTGLEAPDEVTVRRTPGKSIDVRVVRAEGDPVPLVSASSAFVHVEGRRLEDGTYRIVGLPEGEYEVSAFVSNGSLADGTRSTSGKTSAGGSIVLTIPPKAPR